MSEGGIKVSDF